MHPIDALGEKVPLGHNLHGSVLLLLLKKKVPGAQNTHPVLLIAEAPIGHLSHAVAPMPDAYAVMLSHPMHTNAPMAVEKLPGKQAAHDPPIPVE